MTARRKLSTEYGPDSQNGVQADPNLSSLTACGLKNAEFEALRLRAPLGPSKPKKAPRKAISGPSGGIWGLKEHCFSALGEPKPSPSDPAG
jgi:hypothetical protein